MAHKLLSLVFLSLILTPFYLTHLSPVSADIINPEWLDKKCDVDEIEVTCSYRTEMPFGPHTSDNCVGYKLNPSYRFLVAHGSSNGGGEKYCFKAIGLLAQVQYLVYNYLLLLLLTLPLELAILWLLRFIKNRKILQAVIAANAVSVLLLVLAKMFLKLDLYIVLAIGEIIVFSIEVAIIRLIVKEFGFFRIFVSVLIANLVSAIFGTIALYLIQQNIFSLFLH